jgi:transposase
MTLDESIQGIRLRVIQRSQELGNASAAGREFGISRTLFYRWRQRLERYGPDGVHPRRHQARRGRPSQLSPQLEQLAIGVALGCGTWGCGRLAAHWRTGTGYGWRPARSSPCCGGPGLLG